MSMMKRVLTLCLALVLVFNLLPTVQMAEATTDSAATETGSPVVVYEDSFEVGEGGTFTLDGTSDKVTTADNQNYWHGAAPAALSGNTTLFTQDWQSGGVIVSGGVGGAGKKDVRFARSFHQRCKSLRGRTRRQGRGHSRGSKSDCRGALDGAFES